MKKNDFFEMDHKNKQNYQPEIDRKFEQTINQEKFEKKETPEFDQQQNQGPKFTNEREQFYKRFDEKFQQNQDRFENLDEPEQIPVTNVNRTTSYSYQRGGGTPFTYQAEFPPRQMSHSMHDNGNNRTTSYSYTSNYPGEFRNDNFRQDFDQNVEEIRNKFSHYNQGPMVDPHEKFTRQNLEYSQPMQIPRTQSTHTSKKVSKNTTIKNGKKVTVTTTEITNPDGTTTYEKYEETDDGNGNVTVRKYNDRY